MNDFHLKKWKSGGAIMNDIVFYCDVKCFKKIIQYYNSLGPHDEELLINDGYSNMFLCSPSVSLFTVQQPFYMIFKGFIDCKFKSDIFNGEIIKYNNQILPKWAYISDEKVSMLYDPFCDIKKIKDKIYEKS